MRFPAGAPAGFAEPDACGAPFRPRRHAARGLHMPFRGAVSGSRKVSDCG